MFCQFDMLSSSLLIICCSFLLCLVRKPLCLVLKTLCQVSLTCCRLDLLLYAVHFHYVLSDGRGGVGWWGGGAGEWGGTGRGSARHGTARVSVSFYR